MSFAYLASPYTAPDAETREYRFKAACKSAARFMQQGLVVFSPIAHSHPIEIEGGWQESGEFWKRQDEPYLMACDRLIVLCLPGWMTSRGVAHEIKVAKERGIPIEYVVEDE